VRKIQILFIMLVSSLFVLPVTILSNPDSVWADKAKSVIMELDGTEWDVTMVYVTKKGKKNTSEDKLIFSEKKFISEKYEKNGYDPTNYSLTLEGDGSTKFGTMQIKGKETLFWKGNVENDTIDGSVHTQFAGGKSPRTTYFNGTLVTGELKEKVKKPLPPAPVVKKVPVVVEPVAAVEQVEKTVETVKKEPQKPAAVTPTEKE